MPRIEYKALAQRVLAVAVEGNAGDWSAYIDAVPGNRHDDEYLEVKDNGEKLPEAVAKILFPDWANRFTWRD